MEYLWIKWLHVLSSTVLFGTGIGSAYYMLAASLGGDARVVAAVVRRVVIADSVFTTPTIVLQPVTGLFLAHRLGLPLSTPWLSVSIGLYLLAGAAWLPVVWMQVRMRDMAQRAAEAGEPLPRAYGRYLRLWAALGVVAFASLVVVFWLMVVKPA